MRLLLGRSVWGLEADPAAWPGAVATVAARGYGAISLPVQLVADPGPLREALRTTRVALVAQIFTAGRGVDEHLASLAAALEVASSLGSRHVQLQGGRDGWDDADAHRFVARSLDVAAAAGVPVLHETHRTRVLYTPWRVERLLSEIPEVRLVADLSHWTCVAESLRLPERVVAAVAGAAQQVDVRVGWEQGPQVADPRLPGAAPALEAFERWWDAIWRAQEAAGHEELFVQPEHGPPPYQPVDPTTGEPFADVDEVNEWLAARVRARYPLPPLPTT